MRKTPEQVLTEWTTQEFTLDLGQGTKTYGADDYCRLCIALALDGHNQLENLLKREFQNDNMRRAYSTAWDKLVSIILKKMDDKAAVILMNSIFNDYKLMWLSGIVDFEDYFEQVILDNFGICDGLRPDCVTPMSSERLRKLRLNMFMPKGETRLDPGYIYAPYIPDIP